MEINIFQAIAIGLMSCFAASTIACLGTSIGNYTLNRPLVASLFIGLILGDVPGVIMIGIPMQIMFIALVTPGGTVATDLRAVSYIGIPIAYLMATKAGVAYNSETAKSMSILMATATGTIGISMFYGTAMMNLIWQHIGWAKIDKGDLNVIGKVNTIYPLISHFALSFIPTVLLVYFGQSVVDEIAPLFAQDVWYVRALIQVGALLPAVGIAILLKSVVSKMADLLFFVFGFTLAASMGLSLIAATAVGAVFAYINYQLAMTKMSKSGAGSMDDDEEDI